MPTAEQGDNRQLQGIALSREMFAVEGIEQMEDDLPLLLCHGNSFVRSVINYLNCCRDLRQQDCRLCLAPIQNYMYTVAYFEHLRG